MSERALYIKAADGTQIAVEWKSAFNQQTETGSCLWHATADGKTPVCGTPVVLGDDDPYPGWVPDRSRDLMACKRCQERVYRAPRP